MSEDSTRYADLRLVEGCIISEGFCPALQGERITGVAGRSEEGLFLPIQKCTEVNWFYQKLLKKQLVMDCRVANFLKFASGFLGSD